MEGTIMRKLISVLLVLVALPLALSACGPDAQGSTASAKPVSLNGTWKAEGFEATVAQNSIEVNIVSADTSSLYWKGTFPAGSESVKSVADKEALSSAMLGSQDAEKTFTVKDETISFKITMMGTSQIIHLKKA